MKIRNLLWVALFGVLAIGCQDDESKKASLDSLDPQIRGFLTMRMSSSKALSMSGDAAINQSYQNLIAEVNGMRGGRVAKDSTVDSDTIIYQDPWQSCAVVTQIENEDGTITYIYDYGDGCEEGWGDYKYLMHGKYTYTYKYSSSRQGPVYKYDYQYFYEYDNYGGQYYSDSVGWFTDGYSEGQGSCSYDTTVNKFSGNSTFDGTMEYGYGEVRQRYISRGKSQYDDRGGIVSENDYEYGNDESYYRSKVTRALISDYTCNQDNSFIRERYIWVYVSGREVVQYKQDGKEGTFEIDYGNGHCDNIIHIIEDGERTEVDLGDVIFYCGDGTWADG